MCTQKEYKILETCGNYLLKTTTQDFQSKTRNFDNFNDNSFKFKTTQKQPKDTNMKIVT